MTRHLTLVILHSTFGIFMFLSLSACIDQTFAELPVTKLGIDRVNVESLLQNPIPINRGLFYRQLTQNGFTGINGIGRFIYPPTDTKGKAFELILISCQKDTVMLDLFATIHPTYQSIIDIITFDPEKFELNSIEINQFISSFTDIKLIDRRNNIIHPDTTRIQINNIGKMDEILLCCDL